MTNSAVTVVVGLSALLIVMSTLASGLLRLLQRRSDAHASELFNTLGRLLDGTDDPGPGSVTRALYDLPEIGMLAAQVRPGGWRRSRSQGRTNDSVSERPTHIPTDIFVRGVLRLVKVRDEIPQGPRSEAMPFLEAVAEMETAEATTHIESLYGSAMHAATTRFRLRTRWGLFGIGLLFAIVGSVDVIEVGRALWEVDSQRVLAAQRIEACGADSETCIAAAEDVLDDLRIPIGYTCDGNDVERVWDESKFFFSCRWNELRRSFPNSVPGWIATALGVSLGAPVWFDLIRRLTLRPSPSS